MGYLQNVIVSLAASGYVLLLELTSEFLIFISLHIIVIKQVISSLLDGLVGCRVIKLKMIVRRVLRSMVLVLLIIIRVKVTAAHVQDDVIIIGIHAATCIQLVTVVEGEVGSHRVNKPGGIYAMPPVIVIGVVRFLQDGATLAKVLDGHSDKVQVEVIIVAIPVSLI